MVGELDVVKMVKVKPPRQGNQGWDCKAICWIGGTGTGSGVYWDKEGAYRLLSPPAPPPQLEERMEERMHPCARSSKGMQGGVEGPNRLTHLAWEVNWGLRRHGPASSGKADEEGDGGMRGG